MAHEHLEGRTAGAIGGLDEIGAGNAKHLGACQARKGGHGGDAYGDGGIEDAVAQHDDDGQGEQESRDGQQHIHNAHDHGIDPAAAHSSDDAQNGADDEAEEYGQQRA